MHNNRDRFLIYGAALLRALGIGLLGVLLGIVLFRAGASSLQIGLVVATGIAGGAAATSIVSFYADILGRRHTLAALSVLASLGGIGLALTPPFSVLLAIAFGGMLNGTGTDRGAAFALEQAVLPGLVSDSHRTWALSWYNVILDGGSAVGALAAGLPFLLQSRLALDRAVSYRYILFGYAALNLLSGILYLLMSPKVEVAQVTKPEPLCPVSPQTKSIVMKLAALFSLDSLGGGFLTDALVSYWFFRRFGIPEYSLGVLFFAVHLLNAGSHLGAAWLAKRFGLLNTMVFTHLPSSVLLIAVPLAPSFKIAILLFLLREALVEMDVPTRQSYVAAVVRPEERTFASGITNLTRNIGWAVGSSLAGISMQGIAFSAPLVVGGGLKIGYDVLLYRSFRHLKPPEEQKSSAEHGSYDKRSFHGKQSQRYSDSHDHDNHSIECKRLHRSTSRKGEHTRTNVEAMEIGRRRDGTSGGKCSLGT
jgi:MFS family permease